MCKKGKKVVNQLRGKKDAYKVFSYCLTKGRSENINRPQKYVNRSTKTPLDFK